MKAHEILGIGLSEKEKEKLKKMVEDEEVKFLDSRVDSLCDETCDNAYLVIIPWRTWKMYSRNKSDEKIIHIRPSQSNTMGDVNVLSECVVGISSDLIKNKKEIKKLLESAKGLNKFILDITKEKELYRELYLKKSENLNFLENFFNILKSCEFNIDIMLEEVFKLISNKFKINDMCILINKYNKWISYISGFNTSLWEEFLQNKFKIKSDDIVIINTPLRDNTNKNLTNIYDISVDPSKVVFFMATNGQLLTQDDYRLLDIVITHLCTVLMWIIRFDQLSDYAYKDPLTQVGNRHYFDYVLQHEIKRHMRLNSKFSVILLDIDNFKTINDTYGHHVGDMILKQLAKKLKQGIREIDHIIRFGGEEFLIILPHTTKENALNLAIRIKDTIENSVFIAENRILNITVSMGVSEFDPILEKEIYDAIKRADSALYRAKREGKNRAYVE